MDLISLIVILITFIGFLMPLYVFYYLKKYKEAALGLIFTKIDKSIVVFKIYAVAILVFAIGRFLDLFNVGTYSTTIDEFATVLNLLTTLLLIYTFYSLYRIMRIKEKNLN
jgi:hypothetical protein